MTSAHPHPGLLAPGIALALALAASTGAGQGARCVFRDYLGHVSTPAPPIGMVVRHGIAYAALEHTGLLTIDVADPGAMRVLGQAPSTSNYPSGVALIGGYAFMASGGWLEVFDVQVPEVPLWITKRRLPSGAWEIDAWDQWLFIPCGAEGLLVFEASTPTSPKLVATFPTYRATDVHVVDGIAYIADDLRGLVMLDVTDPAAPALLGRYHSEAGKATNVWAEWPIAYLNFTHGDGPAVEIVDVTVPLFPELLATCEGIDWAHEITSAAGRICLADDLGMRVVDAAAPQDPRLVGAYPSSEGGQDVAIDPAEPTIAFVAGGEGNKAGIWAVDISEPKINPPNGVFSGYGQADEIEVEGSLAFLTTSTAGMHIVDISDPRRPTPLSYYPAPTGDVEVVGTTAYLAASARGLRLLDVSNPAAPVEGPWYKPPGHRNSTAIAVVDGIVYLLDSYDHLYVLQDSILEGVALLGACDLPVGDPYRMDLGGGFAYIAAGPTGLVVVDVSDPRLPHVVSAFGTPRAFDVVVEGEIAYVIDESWELAAISVADPSAPELLWTRAMQFNARYTPSGVTVADGTVCAVGLSALEMFDVSDPLAPRLVGVAPLEWAARDVEVRGRFAFVCGRTMDLEVIDLADCPPAPGRGR